MSWKVRFCYGENAEKASGWSTGFYNNATDLVNCQSRANKMAATLVALTGDETRIQFIRVSNVQKPRQALTYRFLGTALINPKSGTPPANPSDVPLVGIQLQLRTGDLTLKANLSVRGIPDEWTVGGIFVGGAGSGTAIAALKALLMSGAEGWIIRTLDPTRAMQPITDISAAGVVTTLNPLAIPNPPVVILNRVGNMPGTTRRFKAINAAGNTFQLFPWPSGAAKPTVTAASQAAAATYIESAIGYIEANTSVTHKVGRPFKLASGRLTR